jgi:hypothetical protein
VAARFPCAGGEWARRRAAGSQRRRRLRELGDDFGRAEVGCYGKSGWTSAGPWLDRTQKVGRMERWARRAAQAERLAGLDGLRRRDGELG